MRILFITDFYHPYSGGVENHVRAVARELADRDHRVAVATLPPPADSPARSHDGPVEIFTVQHSAQRIGARFRHQDRPWAPPFPDPLAVAGLRKVIVEFRPDLIHGHDWLARSALPAVLGTGIPVVNTLHYYTRTCAKKTLWRDGAVCPGPRLDDCRRCAAEHYGPVRGAVVTLGLRLGARLEDRRGDRWISVSNATAAGNGLDGRDRSAVVANPVPTPAPLSEAERAELDLSALPDGDFILFVGDIRPEKGMAVLARAVELLRSEHGNRTPLVVAGERMDRSIALPDNTVDFGLLPNAAIHELWGRATVGVVPSLWPEPFGLVAIEAMAAGCPLVASDIGGLKDILSDGGGTLVPPGDAPAMAAALAELLTDPEARSVMATVARRQADRYGLERIVDQIEQQYRLAIETSQARGS